jgi:hypothetical protein
MTEYLVKYTTFDSSLQQYFLCQANDREHAIEQAADHEVDGIFVQGVYELTEV